MRLRLKLNVLIFTVLVLVLAGSFAWLFTDLKAEFREKLKIGLQTSAASFQAQERQRFRTLEVMANSLETSPGFRNVLRKTDFETLKDFLDELNKRLQVDFIAITDADGRVIYRSDVGREAVGQTLEQPAVKLCLDGIQVFEYWFVETSMFQTVSVPLVDSQDYIDGTLNLGFVVDQAYLNTLARESDVDLQISNSEGFQLRTLDSAPNAGSGDFLSKALKLGFDPESPAATLLLSKSLSPIDQFVSESSMKLGSLAVLALLLAMAASVPIIGKMTNPVELLEQAQAEMETIFSTNLDGLVATDELGIVTAVNPAATLAFGLEQEEMLGRNLDDLLPDEAKAKLADSPAGLTQRIEFGRQGRQYKLYRKFVRRAQSEELGSILLVHDCTEEGQERQRLAAFVEGVSEEFLQADSPPGLRMAFQNLVACGSGLPETVEELSLQALCADVATNGILDELEHERSFKLVKSEGSSRVLACRTQLGLCIENLLDNARRHGSGDITLKIERNGGAFSVEISDLGGGPPEGILNQLFLDPFQSSGDKIGVGLWVCQKIVERFEGKISFAHDERCRFTLTLPAAPGEAEC